MVLKNYSQQNYQKDLFLLKKLTGRMGDSIDDSSYTPEYRKTFFEVYNRVFLYCCSYFYQRLFSEKELKFMFFHSNLTNFREITEFELVNLEPLTEKIFYSYRKKLQFFSNIWERLNTQPGSRFVKYDLDESSSGLEAGRRNLQKLKESGITKESNSYKNYVYLLNVNRKSLLESLAARYTLVNFFQKLKNFEQFEDVIFYTIFFFF